MTFDIIDNAVRLIKLRMLELSDYVLRDKLYGGGCEKYKEEFELLADYRDALLIYRNLFIDAGECEGTSTLPDNTCCSEEDLEILLEKVSMLVDRSCEAPVLDLIIDEDGLDEWKLAHPTEIPYETWEKAALGLCQLTHLSLKKRKDVLCDVYFKITEDYTDCSLTFKESIKEPDCKLEYKEIFESANCDLTFDEYFVMRQCGISIKEIIKNTNCDNEVSFNLKDTSTFEGC